jgi:hypothetical protein
MKSLKNAIFQGTFHYKKSTMLGRTWYFYLLKYRELFHIIFIHSLNQVLY